ncbi:hypothetical protein AAG570_008328 [Ranatra chinensis]|uniref:Exocyst complex component Sec8 n=1 Tax=Ranatra chinensis TaxID=642074 RepID=A0ABD0XSU1_9HEMI
MSVIRTLSASESNEQRDREKAKLEREYKKSDQQLNELVSLHNGDLTNVMQLFGKMSTTISGSREKLLSVKKNLYDCKKLLSCRRDELKKLWLERIEHKQVLQLLEEIEQLREVPSKLDAHLNNKQYLEATKLMVSALSLGDGALEGVEALRELKNELQAKKEKLYHRLLEELTRVVYIHSIKEVDCFRRESGSMREKSRWARKNVENADLSCKDEPSDSSEVQSGLINTFVECLVLLQKLSDAVENIKVGMQSEILSVVNQVSKTLVTNPSEGVHPLLDLLEVLTQQLRIVADCHMALLNSLNTVAKTNNLNLNLYQPSDVWSTIQAVLQLLLTDYLDIQNTASETQQAPTTFSDPGGDISSYFARRRPQRSRKSPLFKFEYSSHAVCVSAYMKDQSIQNGLVDIKQREKLLVCSPDPFNITVIFQPLQKFIEEIEQAVGGFFRKPCTLNAFVGDYVKEVFIGREQTRILAKIESATKTADAWRTPTPPSVVAEMDLPKPLLLSTVLVSDAINNLESLLDTLSVHKDQMLMILVNLVRGYTETCHAAYRDLQAQKTVNRSGKILRREDTVEEESPEDVRQRNIKEAEILASNLGEGGIGAHEIISDPIQLKCLALLQESMEWFAWRVLQITSKLKKNLPTSPTENGPPSLSHCITSLQNMALEFEELANTCLLVLHLEVRVQCFHYLLPKGNGSERSGINIQDPDPRVLDLSRVLVTIDESLSSSLQPRKTKYIFEGLGHLIAKILMSSAQYMERIDEAAIHKMCRNIFTLQQTLTNITVAREIALNHARDYFQLFFLTPEDILNRVLEKGPEFTELEYMNAFQLIDKSYNDQDPSLLQRHLQRLSDILGEVGVTV